MALALHGAPRPRLPAADAGGHRRHLDDPIELLLAKRKPNGRWPLQNRIPGTMLVEMEKPGQDGRWNTLRALRVLRRRSA
jgi:hypothetical protein